jgi:hypothetical protein
MSGRGLVPLILAVGFGIANGEKYLQHYSQFDEVDTNNPGYVVFNPAFQEREAEKIRKEQ